MTYREIPDIQHVPDSGYLAGYLSTCLPDPRGMKNDGWAWGKKMCHPYCIYCFRFPFPSRSFVQKSFKKRKNASFKVKKNDFLEGEGGGEKKDWKSQYISLQDQIVKNTNIRRNHSSYNIWQI